MYLSTDLPCGAKAIADYLASGGALRMNVSKEADRAFRFELRKSDVKRWANLEAAMFRDFYGKRSNARVPDKNADFGRLQPIDGQGLINTVFHISQ